MKGEKMKIICNKKEFANLVINCDQLACGSCVFEAFCESESRKNGDIEKPEGFIQMCEIKEDKTC